MADDQSDVDTQSEGTDDQDPMKNLRGEFSRKFQNMQAKNEELIAQNSQLIAKIDQVIATTTKTTQEPEIDYEDLKYSDPDKYVELKMKEVESRVDQKIGASLNQQNAKNQTIQAMMSEYPELASQDSALVKKAIELGKRYSEEFVGTPEGIRLVIREAASQLGILPSAVRAQMSSSGDSMDDFIAGSNSGSNRKQEQRKKDDLDPKTKVVAELMGLDVNDKAVIERLKKHQGRKWQKWE